MGSLKEQIADLQKEIFSKQKELAQLIKSQEPEELASYSLKDSKHQSHKLIDLFEGKDELIVIHNMGKSCVYCTMWADTLSGAYTVIKDRVNIILSSPDDVDTMAAFAQSRDWKLPCYSYHGTDFSKDLGFAEDKEGRRWYHPGFSVLTLKDGVVYRTAKDYFGPGDVYCAPWHLFELLPKGVNAWQPKYNY